MTVKAFTVTTKVRREAIIVERDSAVESLENVAKATGKDYSEDIELIKNNATEKLAELDATEEAQARFTFTELEKKLYKDYYKKALIASYIQGITCDL
ncbi:hypothetical protein [Butyrivibrio sp. YAB3001]|uniref:hypothetical protein n=1 Tax=Butyrivibrio sp. YAB3001 TaxID=1520812 RepID=UPI0008F61752|nr:hypothetical protein [Butyrivibrio sp. YAB3001]SFD11227.1 hypothetical protein SAMN02910398_04093 [Butyrivibrio sp. YAB3001]